MCYRRTGKVLYAAIIFASFCLVSHRDSFAVVTTTLTNVPTTITSDSFSFVATISGATAGTNYLRVDLYKDQTTNYFGSTYNGSYWYTGPDYTQFFPITVVSGAAWTGTIQGIFGDYPDSAYYDGTGTYKIRLRRYTSGGSYTASEANLTAATVLIVVPTMTPTPSPTSVPTGTPTNPPPTATTAPTPTKIPTPTSKLSTSSPSAVLSASTSADPLLDATVSGKDTLAPSIATSIRKTESTRNSNTMSKVALASGVLLISSCVILLFRQIKA